MREYVIWSWRHSQWWKPDHAGYTSHLSEAGRYTEQEAGAIHTGSGLPGCNTAIQEQTAKNCLDLASADDVERMLDSLRRS